MAKRYNPKNTHASNQKDYKFCWIKKKIKKIALINNMKVRINPTSYYTSITF